MRTFAIIVGGILFLAALSGFALFMLMRQPEGHAAGEMIGATPAESPRQPLLDDGAIKDELAALTKRVDRLADEIEQLRMSSSRAGVPAPMPDPPQSDAFVAAHRDDVFRLIAEDEDLRALPARRTEFALALVHAFEFYAIPNPNGKELGDCVKVLVEAEMRRNEIRRRIVPPHESPAAEGPWKAALDAEMGQLRAWRESELARVVGADAARKLASSLGGTQRL